MGLFSSRQHPTGQAQLRETVTEALLPELIDAATGGRRGMAGGRRIGWRGALAIPAVWSAVRLRANVIASLPVGVFRTNPDTGRPQRVPDAQISGVLSTPSSTFDMTDWLAAGQLALDLRGNNWGRILARDPRTNLATQIELVHPDEVTTRIRKRDGAVEYVFAGNVVDKSEVWHERQNPTPGEVEGLSPIGAAARALGVNLAALEYGSGFFDEALTPSALLSSDGPIDEQGAKLVKRRVMATQQGREPLVLGGNWRFQQLSVNPAEAMFLEVMRYGDADVARMFDVPAEMIEANTSGSSITYANREQRTQDLLAFRLGPAIARRERALTRLTPRGQYVKLNVAALLRGDLLTRYQSYNTALHAGFLGLDEVRELEDREPMTAEQLAQLAELGLLGKITTTTTTTGPADAGTPATTPQEVPA